MTARYATHKKREDMAASIESMESTVHNPMAWERIQNKDGFKKRLAAEKKKLIDCTPPDVTGTERDAIKERLKLLESAMVEGNAKVNPMPSQREMWEANAGDVGKHSTWEKTWLTHTVDPSGNMVRVTAQDRPAIMEWKDLRRTLFKEREADDNDVANIEMIRPRVSRLSLAEQQTPRSYGFTGAVKENYDEAFPDHPPTQVEAKLAEPKMTLPPDSEIPNPFQTEAKITEPPAAPSPYLNPRRGKPRKSILGTGRYGKKQQAVQPAGA